jgi:hypothetical protein
MLFEKIYRMLKWDGLFFVRCKSTKDPFYGKGALMGPDMFFDGHLRHFFSRDYLKEKLHNYDILSLEETSSSYNNKTSSFVEAIVRKKECS